MKAIVCVAAGILFAAGLTCFVLMSNDSRQMANNGNRESQASASPGNDAPSKALPNDGQPRTETSDETFRIHSRRRSYTVVGDNATPKDSAKGHGLIGTIVLPCLAGTLAIVGVGLLVGGLRSHPPKRRGHKHACTAVFVENAGRARRHTSVVPVTVSFPVAGQQAEAPRVSFLDESEETEDLRRAG